MIRQGARVFHVHSVTETRAQMQVQKVQTATNTQNTSRESRNLSLHFLM